MKIFCNSSLIVLALAALLTYSGCENPPPPPTVDAVQLEKLTGTWKVVAATTNVTLNGVSQKADWSAFNLTISGTPDSPPYTYTTTGRPARLNPWPSNGSWTFGGAPESIVIRDDDVEITYTVSDTQLELTFNFQGDGYNRTKEVKGLWVFTLAK